VAQTITEFSLFTSNSEPLAIAPRTDGLPALWFTEATANKYGQIGMNGNPIEFSSPSANSEPLGIAFGPDGRFWIAELNADKIAQVSQGPVQYNLASGSEPYWITAGPDGALWFTEIGANKIGRITTTGAITEFPITTSASSPCHITTGPDGALWFTEFSGNNIGRITTTGAITEFPIPTPNFAPCGITLGPDGALWFSGISSIGRITTVGVITNEFSLRRMLNIQTISRLGRTARCGSPIWPATRSGGSRPPVW
jgi:virginiamycin B lyase